MTALHLETRDRLRLRAAQEALLSPLASKSPTDWQLGANRAVRAFLGADHSVFIRPPSEEATSVVTTHDTDPAFEEGLLRLAAEAGPGSRYRDSFLQRVHRRRIRNGRAAYHLDELTDPEERAAAPSFQEIFVPCRMEHLVALTTATPAGVVTQSFSFESRDAPGYTKEGLEKLRLVVPAFLAGVRTFYRWIGRWRELGAMVDRVPQALAVYDQAGRRLYANRGLVGLLADARNADALDASMDELAGVFAARLRGPRRAQEDVPLTVGRRVRTGRRVYRLSATYGPSPVGGERTILVSVERSGLPLPPPTTLEDRHGLTPREAEVALLLAEGCSDKALARRLDVSWHTARTHVRNVLDKLGLSSRARVASTLLQDGST